MEGKGGKCPRLFGTSTAAASLSSGKALLLLYFPVVRGEVDRFQRENVGFLEKGEKYTQRLNYKEIFTQIQLVGWGPSGWMNVGSVHGPGLCSIFGRWIDSKGKTSAFLKRVKSTQRLNCKEISTQIQLVGWDPSGWMNLGSVHGPGLCSIFGLN